MELLMNMIIIIWDILRIYFIDRLLSFLKAIIQAKKINEIEPEHTVNMDETAYQYNMP